MQYLAEFCMVMCSGPKNNGAGTAAAGVSRPMIEARPIMITKAGILIPLLLSSAIATA